MIKIGEIINGSRGRFMVVDNGNFGCIGQYSVINLDKGKVVAMENHLQYIEEDLDDIVGKLK